MGLDKRAVSDEKLLALMIREPRLIRRPLMIIDSKPVVGFDKEKMEEVVKKMQNTLDPSRIR